MVAPLGALAEVAREAPVARYQGVLKGLVWCAAGLYYGVLAPDQATFQVWEADPLGGTGPTLLWSYPYASFLLKEVSPDGRYAWVGAALVDLVAGELVQVREKANVQSFVFSQDGASWLYAYSTVADLKRVWALAVRQAGASEADEQVLLEAGKQIAILDWSSSGLVGLFLVHRDAPELVFLGIGHGE